MLSRKTVKEERSLFNSLRARSIIAGVVVSTFMLGLA